MDDVLLVLTVALVTAGIRFLPFVLFPEGRNMPAYVTYLSAVLPCAAMGMLVVYCLKGVDLSARPHGLPEIIAVALIVGLHAWRRNTLLSILAGTACYMLLLKVFV